MTKSERFQVYDKIIQEFKVPKEEASIDLAEDLSFGYIKGNYVPEMTFAKELSEIVIEKIQKSPEAKLSVPAELCLDFVVACAEMGVSIGKTIGLAETFMLLVFEKK